MFPRAVIYQSGRSVACGEVKVAAPLAARIVYGFLRGVGAGLIGFATIVLVFTFGEPIKEEIFFALGRRQMKPVYNGFAPLLDRVEADRINRVREEAAELGLDSNFSIFIPQIGARARVIANVDAGREEEYQAALTEGVAHARGTGFPGEGRQIYLFAHSTDSPVNFARYNAVFYLLGKLEEGDTVTIFFADRKYRYRVARKVITSAEDVSWLTDADQSTERLVLQTCYPPGTNWQRLLVVALPR